MNVLIVDDSSTVRVLIRRALESSQLAFAEILEAENGLKGLEVLKANWVDLVLADLNMPVMDGEAMITAMRKDEASELLPVVVISAEGSREVLDKLRALGVQQIVRKPFDPSALSDAISAACGGALL
jgi:two-component system chemotaxis response regulator CheY